MKVSYFGLALLGWLQVTMAMPSGNLVKRASPSDKCDVGFCTQGSGTTGGSGGKTINANSLSALEAAVAGDEKKIVILSGTITGAKMIQIGANTSLLGKSGASLVGVGLSVKKKSNVIIRNLKISKVTADTGDAISIQYAKNVWVDHVELSSAMDKDKDFYDGLLDVTHGCDFITISYVYFHDHWKASLVGHSDNNGGEDKGHLTVTYHHNYFKNINSRCPSFRFGTGHVFNNYFEAVNDGINTRQGATVVVENNVFSGTKKPIYSTDGGFAAASGNDLGGGTNAAPAGTARLPYKASIDATASVKGAVTSGAGAKLSF